MQETFESGPELLKALKDRSLDTVIAGLVKPSDGNDQVSFSISGGRHWIDIPTKMIRRAERLQIDGTSRTYPAMRLTLQAPSTAEGKVFLELLRASSINLAEHLEVAGDLPCSCGPTSIARDDAPPDGPSGTGQWCCKKGKAYICGCYPDGVPLVCCSEWEPCKTMGPAAGVVMM